MSTDTRDTRDTKERLLDAAEVLCAEHGFAATSLRDITAAADANLASVNYHFGSKEELIAAVFERRLAPVNGDRLALLDRVERDAHGAPPALEAILWAYLAPPFRQMRALGDTGHRFMQLVGRVHSDPKRSMNLTFVEQFAEVKRRFQQAVSRALPDLESEEIERRLHYVVGAMAHSFMFCDAVCCLAPADSDDDTVLESLIAFAVGGFRAGDPRSDTTPEALRPGAGVQ